MHSMAYLMAISLFFVASCGPTLSAHKDVAVPDASASVTPSDTTGSGFKVIVFDVGEGDAALVISPEGEAALIDIGPPGTWNQKLGTYLNDNSDINLKYIILTHSDSDHAGALAESLLKPDDVNAGDVLKLGDNVTLNILVKDCKFSDGVLVACEADDDNAHSAAILVEFDSFRYLATGDLPGGGGNPPYDTIDLESHLAALAGDIDVLHAGHHGSNTSTNKTLLDLTGPEAAIISVGNNNDYWHPHQSVIERLVAAGIEIYQTERGWLKDEFLDDVNIMNGNIVIESDGNLYDINP